MSDQFKNEDFDIIYRKTCPGEQITFTIFRERSFLEALTGRIYLGEGDIYRTGSGEWYEVCRGNCGELFHMLIDCPACEQGYCEYCHECA